MKACRLALLVALAVTLPAVAQEHGYVLIVNAANPAKELKRDQLATLFLERAARWGHGPGAEPVDQSLASAVRGAFSRDALGKAPQAVQSYWQKRIVTEHEAPPPVKGSDAEVIAHVEKSKGGIGYVSEGTALPPTVKAIKLTE
jgi:ABC-type phosphate transport system substrate-binding protein